MIYRNQTNTISQITMMSHMRITTVQEAVAFLRAIQPLNEQVAAVLQRTSLIAQRAVNKVQTPAPAPEPTPAPAPEPEKKFEPEDISSDEGYSTQERKQKLAKLKKANEPKSEKESN